MKDYAPDEFKKLAKFFGYKLRTGTYYIISESDGYINISCHPRGITFDGMVKCFLYEFHKNHYQGVYDSNGIHKKDISFKSENFNEFIEWMCKYHIKQGRKLKLKQIEKIEKKN